MDFEKITACLSDQPAFRLKQVKSAIFKDLLEDWRQATSLPVNLRQRLSEEAPLALAYGLRSSGESEKALVTLADGSLIETVLIRNRDGRHTVCLSSQVGCPLGCLFCATGRLGFRRNLRADEIVSQFLIWARLLAVKNETINNVVYMGMGEPLLNYDEVMASIRMINDPDMCNLGARHISISTAGIVPGIKKLAKEKLQINLAVSLHASDNETRNRLMPINKKYEIAEVIDAVDEYIALAGRQVMFEYLLIKGVNDAMAQARRLAVLMAKPLYMVNLLSYNPTGGFEASDAKTAREFKKILDNHGVRATLRQSAGADIAAACGQLAALGK